MINQTDTVLSTGAQQFGDSSRPPFGAVLQPWPLRSGQLDVGWTGALSTQLGRYPARPTGRAGMVLGHYSLTASASDDVHPNGHMNHWACYTELQATAWLTDRCSRACGGALAKLADLPTGMVSSRCLPAWQFRTPRRRPLYRIATSSAAGGAWCRCWLIARVAAGGCRQCWSGVSRPVRATAASPLRSRG